VLRTFYEIGKHFKKMEHIKQKEKTDNYFILTGNTFVISGIYEQI